MIDPSWRIEDPDPDEAAAGGPPPALATLRFLLAALRRRWRIWVGLGIVGMMLGVAWTVVMPVKSVGTVTLLLEHDPNADPDQAMSTDMSLLRTRSVASSVIRDLGLRMTPEAFQKSVIVTPVSTKVLILEVPAPGDAAAVARAEALSRAYLDFRTGVIRLQSQGLIDGYQDRLRDLQDEAERLTDLYDTYSSGGPDAQDKATDVLAQRSTVMSDINSLQQTMQDARVQTESIITASTELDPPALVPHSSKMRSALAMASGLVGGAAVGMGLVLFAALTSDRLRRREEVALALGAPVRFSVGKLSGRRAWPWRIRRRSSPTRDLQVLVHGLDSSIAPRKRGTRKVRPARWALATVDNGDAAEQVIASLAAQFISRDLAVFVVDLSDSGRMEPALRRALGQADQQRGETPAPVVFRPEGVPSLARGPARSSAGVTSDLPDNGPLRSAWDSADVILTLAEVDPAVGVDHLKSWADHVVLLVTAGRSSAERLRTTAELVRSTGLTLQFAMMVGADRTDESLGLPESPDTDWPGARRTS